MYFLGQAGNYKALDILRHTFAVATPRASRKLREHLASRYSVKPKNVVLYNNGRSALAAGLLKTVPKGSEVIITALTCYAVVQGVRAAECVPIFADIDEKTLHFNAKTLASTFKKHPEARAVIVQNNLGITVDITAIERFCKENNLILIEDLAHCTGRFYSDGREAGTVGAFTALSFGKGKSIDTITGGALVMRVMKKGRQGACKVSSRTKEKSEEFTETSTDSGTIRAQSLLNDKDFSLRELTLPNKRPAFLSSLRARLYPLLGAMIRGFYHLHLGRHLTSLFLKLHLIQRSADAPLDLNTRLTHWQAKLALRQFKRLKDQPLREAYLVDDRVTVLRELERNGFVMNDVWYDCPVSPDRYYQKANFPEKDCPVAMNVARHLVNLPTYYNRNKLKPARQIIRRHQLDNQIAEKGVKK